ncbi:MAG: efflux RND transporter permease subunit [Verrucomicrobiales bacterium]|nr:efflux RND transporter permease subunit [Verrucomicrobiales bacterium]
MSSLSSNPSRELGLAGRVARAFIDSKLTPLIIITSVLCGAAAIILLPREEEPQIRAPMVDVLVSMPGFSAKEVEERATRPMEKLLWEIPGVEYIYSTSRPGECLAIVRFNVGEDVERSLVKLNQKLQSNFDRIPRGVSLPLIKPKSIDDVPILALTFHSSSYDELTLRQLVAQVDDAVKQVPWVAETTLIGGASRRVRVLIDPVRLASRDLSATEILPILTAANRQSVAGGLTSNNREILVETGGFLRNAQDVSGVVVGVFAGRPVYLRDIAEIQDTADDPSQYVFFGSGAANSPQSKEETAVTLSVAKRPGANAVSVAHEVLRRVEALKGRVIPRDIQVSVTRDYGATATEKSNELLLHLGIAIAGVSILMLLTLGWRESVIVALATPATLGLTLLVFYLYGYTLNRITLFALIFSIGILVDDAIVVVENIVRHFRLPENRGRHGSAVAIEAVNEVGNPTFLATFAVIAAVLPMAFVGGLSGPYMRPIPIGSSAAMLFSLGIAFIVTPWASVRILRWGRRSAHPAGLISDGEARSQSGRPEDFFTRTYRKLMTLLIARRRSRFLFLASMVGLLFGAMALVAGGWVKMKMLPFDNKSEFQIILNMPEGSALEHTAQVAREIAAVVRTEPEVTDYQVYVGVAAPFNFNGLVRHYFLRRGAHVADLQINLVSKENRRAQSHEIAKRVRPRVADIAAQHGARVAVAEVPPGPPVLQTLVAEIYGPSAQDRLALARKVVQIFRATQGVVDTDWYVESDQPLVRFEVDKEKAALHGISAETISQTLRMAVVGERAGLLHVPSAKEDVDIVVEVPRADRATPEHLLGLRVRSALNPSAPLVPLRELVKVDQATVDPSIHHKNLKPVIYVIGDVAGVVESPVYAILEMNKALRKLDTREFGGNGAPLKIYNATQPLAVEQPSLKWDGEWHLTIELFRDLGTAFAVVLVLIFLLMVGWFRSFFTPLIVMSAIPFSLVGILPAHGAMGAFFTATSLIGFMAGAGIVVRNSIILVDFIEQRLAEGVPLAEAVVDAGAVRFRPMLLTALAVVVGSSVILADPIFQGLAISLMAGEIASLLISRAVVPVLYFVTNDPRKAANRSPAVSGIPNVAPPAVAGIRPAVGA